MKIKLSVTGRENFNIKHHGFTPMVSVGAPAKSAEALTLDIFSENVKGYPPQRRNSRLYSYGFWRRRIRCLRSFLAICTFFCGVCIHPSYALEAQKPSSGEDAAEEEGRLITIPEGIEMVTRDSRLIKIALSDKDMAFSDSLASRSALLPRLDATASETFNRFQPGAKLGSLSVNTGQKQFFSYGFDVYQTLFDFGKTISNYRASKELVEAQKAKAESVKRLAILEFIVAYFDILEAQKMILVASKEVESLASYLLDIQHLYEQGVVIKNDLLPAQVRLADAKQKLIAARSAWEIASSRVANMLALPIGAKVRAQDIRMQLPQFPDIKKAWETAQAQRPEITFFENQLRASILRTKAKAVDNLPVISADGGYVYAQNPYQIHQDNAFVKLQAKVNFYDGGAAKAGLLKERSRQKQISQEKDKLIDDIKLEIEDSYLGLKNACEKVLVAKDALSGAQENVRVNRIKYTEGSATPTDVLEAITLETKAQTNYYNNDYEVKRSYAKLMHSMGIDLTLIFQMMERRKNDYSKH